MIRRAGRSPEGSHPAPRPPDDFLFKRSVRIGRTETRPAGRPIITLSVGRTNYPNRKSLNLRQKRSARPLELLTGRPTSAS